MSTAEQYLQSLWGFPIQINILEFAWSSIERTVAHPELHMEECDKMKLPKWSHLDIKSLFIFLIYPYFTQDSPDT